MSTIGLILMILGYLTNRYVVLRALCILILLMHGLFSVIDTMSYNLITLIPTTNKLTKPSYIDWKRNLDIVLTSDELTWVTQELALSPLNEHSNREETDTYHSW